MPDSDHGSRPPDETRFPIGAFYKNMAIWGVTLWLMINGVVSVKESNHLEYLRETGLPPPQALRRVLETESDYLRSRSSSDSAAHYLTWLGREAGRYYFFRKHVLD